jgi:hypothetical protein
VNDKWDEKETDNSLRSPGSLGGTHFNFEGGLSRKIYEYLPEGSGKGA